MGQRGLPGIISWNAEGQTHFGMLLFAVGLCLLCMTGCATKTGNGTLAVGHFHPPGSPLPTNVTTAVMQGAAPLLKQLQTMAHPVDLARRAGSPFKPTVPVTDQPVPKALPSSSDWHRGAISEEPLVTSRLLYHRDANTVARKLNQLLQGTGAHVVVDRATNTLLLSGSPSTVAQAQQLATSLDVPLSRRVVRLRHSHPLHVARLMTTLLNDSSSVDDFSRKSTSMAHLSDVSDTPDITGRIPHPPLQPHRMTAGGFILVADPRGGTLTVLGPRNRLAGMVEWIREYDQPSTRDARRERER